MPMRLLLLGGALAVLAVAVMMNNRSQAQNTPGAPGNPGTQTAGRNNPVEVGHVTWGRDLDAALAQSGETGKPLFVLFQEVPGCQGCQDFGKTVLTEPLLIEAIEDEFIPVLVYNNQAVDREILKRFKEPAWNYQVVRFLNAEGKDLIPRKDRVWTTQALRTRMIAALQAAGRTAPPYLSTVAAEQDPGLKASAYSMFCFWTGEVDLGRLDDVIATQAGWFDGHEVTHVIYNPQQISLETLSNHARQARCAARKVYTAEEVDTPRVGDLPTGRLTHSYRPARASDQSRQMLGYEALTQLPGLTKMQQTKLNAFIRSDPGKALAWLSPRQQAAVQKQLGHRG